MCVLLSRLGSLSKAAASSFSRPAVLIASIAISALVLGLRQLAVLEELELNIYDRLVQLRPDEGPDARLLVVAVTEEDIRALGKWPTSDRTLDQLLGKLEQYKPRVIGLDIYRDLPQEPGNPELATRLQLNEDIIAVCKTGNSSELGVAPPPTVPESRLGFSDIVVDSGGIARRNLMFLTPNPNSPCSATRSFDLQLALHYLEKEGVSAKLTSQEYLQIGSTIFKPIEANTGGYQKIDARGYQVMLNYRSRNAVAQQVTLTDVLKGQINPSWVQDRIVIIGVTAVSGNDFFNTPYSVGQQEDLRMPGAIVHAQMVSQILSAVLDNRSLIWVWPGWGEVLWVWGWSLVGGCLAWSIRHPLLLVVVAGAAVATLGGISYSIFTQGGWIPLAPPVLGIVATIASVITYKAYRAPQQRGVLAESNTVNPISPRENNKTAPGTSEKANNLLVGRYKIIQEIGSGGFGQTYLAEDTQRPGRPHCVVKQLKPTRTEERFLQLARRLFNTEAETLEKLGRHEQIPQLLAYFEEDKEFYLVQEFIKGHSLSDEILAGQQLPESQVVTLLKDVLAILDLIHSYRVIHRDIKPSNIIRRVGDGRLVLIDFGAVKLLHTQIVEGQEGYTVAIGTSGFAPPEQLMGQPLFSSDIYALGIVGIQAVTGRMPTQLKKDAITKEVIWRDHAQISDELADILDKMVRYHPNERYQSAAEVLQAFQHLETKR